MSNASLHEQAIKMTTYGLPGDIPSIEIAICGIDFIILFVGVWLFYINQHNPMIKFRSWSLNLLLVLCLSLDDLLAALAAVEGFFNYNTVGIYFYMRAITSTIFIAPLFVRY